MPGDQPGVGGMGTDGIDWRIIFGCGHCFKRTSRALGFLHIPADSCSPRPLTHFIVTIWPCKNGRSGIFYKISPCTCQTLSILRLHKTLALNCSEQQQRAVLEANFSLSPPFILISHVFLRIWSFGKEWKIRSFRLLERLLHNASAPHLWLSRHIFHLWPLGLASMQLPVMGWICVSARTVKLNVFAFVLKKLWKKTVYSGIELIWEFPKQCLTIKKTYFW